jgi:glucose-6-phosphate dehydrogenase assembly protein OpcA
MEIDLMEPVILTSPAHIQSELARIWDTMEGANKMRACLFNLIIYAEKSMRDAYLHTIAQKVIEKFPSRIIFVTDDKASKESYLKSSVSVMSAGKGESEIACDLIQIEVAGKQHERLPFVILPLILADLPVYLVLAEDPIRENPLSYELEKFASRLIFDSESADSLPHFAASLLNHRKSLGIDVADLNWARMENWRTLFSTIFYSQSRLEQLQQTKQMTIYYNSHETVSFCHTRIQAIYLQAWLSAQLQWECQNVHPEAKKLTFLYKKENSPIEISLIPQDFSILAPGTIISVELTTLDETHFSFTRSPTIPNHILTKITDQKMCELPSQYIFSKGESGKSLVKEICHKGMSAHYLKVLTLLAKMETLSIC